VYPLWLPGALNLQNIIKIAADSAIPRKRQFPDQKHGGQISLLGFGSSLGNLARYGNDLQRIKTSIKHFSALESYISRESSWQKLGHGIHF
jgi:hypothetical protein